MVLLWYLAVLFNWFLSLSLIFFSALWESCGTAHEMSGLLWFIQYNVARSKRNSSNFMIAERFPFICCNCMCQRPYPFQASWSASKNSHFSARQVRAGSLFIYYAPCTCRMRSYPYPVSFYYWYHPWYSLTCIKRRISYVYFQVFLLHVSLFYYFEKYTHWITLQETQIFVRVQMNYSQCYIDPTGHTTTINMLSFTGVVWC